MDALRPRVARYLGLVGALLLAVAAYLGGVFPDYPERVTPASIWAGAYGPVIVVSWLLGTAAMVWAWWTLRHGPPSTRWAYVTVGLWLLPLLVVPPEGSRDVYSYACQGSVYATGGDPYRAGVAELGCPWLDSVATVWRDAPAPYGPVFVLLAGLAVTLGGTLAGTIAVLRLTALAGVVLAAVCLPGLAVRCGISPQRALWLALACPLVAVHLIAGAHNDAVMIGLLVAGLLLAVDRPGRPGPLLAGGVLLGFAVAVKVTAGVVVPFAVLAGIVGGYGLRRLLLAASWVTGGALAAVLAVSGAAGLGFGWLPALARSSETMQWTSPPTAVGFVIGYVGQPFGWQLPGVTVARLAALVFLAVLLFVLWWRTWRRLRRWERDPGRLGAGTAAAVDSTRPARSASAKMGVVAEPARSVEQVRLPIFAAGLALAATVVLAPVFHPWYAMWPLAVLAASALRTTWFVVPCAAANFLVLPDGTNLARFTKAPGAVVMTVLVIMLVYRLVNGWRRQASRP